MRVGLAAVKGLAEPGATPVAAVSRLAVLAHKAGVCFGGARRASKRGFSACGTEGGEAWELLAGAAELATLDLPTGLVAVCDEAAAALLTAAWTQAEIAMTAAPMAADAIVLAAPRILAGSFVDLALLDGHYLRRGSDAEIFGQEKLGGGGAAGMNGASLRVRRMTEADADAVVALGRAPEACTALAAGDLCGDAGGGCRVAADRAGI